MNKIDVYFDDENENISNCQSNNELCYEDKILY